MIAGPALLPEPGAGLREIGAGPLALGPLFAFGRPAGRVGGLEDEDRPSTA